MLYEVITIGQIAGVIHEILPVETIVKNVIAEFRQAQQEISKIEF